MRKPKRKTKSRKPKARASQAHALKERFEAEFAVAVKSARTYVENPDRLEGLFREAVNEARTMPREPFGEMWPYFHAMLRLIRAYSRAEYRDIPTDTMVVIVAAIVYLVNPLDVIPDALPGLGYLDDATVLALAIRRSRPAIDDFMTWEITAL